MPSIRKALALSFAGKYSSLAIHMISAVVLARLLTPAEIGVYSVAAAVVALAHVVRDFGVGNYLIQEKDLTTERIRTAFAVTLIIGWTMAAVIFALSGPVSVFYAEPGLGRVLRVLSLTFLVIPFGSPVLALLHRDMAFARIYVVEVASALAHVTTGITLAALGFGFMSLAWASLAGAVMTATVAMVSRPSVARLLPSFKEWRRVAGFGGYSSAAGLVAQIGVKAVDLVLGRILGFTAVGIYSRAQGLIALFHRDLMGAVHRVAFPAFAIEHREGQNLKGTYLKGISFVTVLAWPFYGFLGLMAYPIVRILFGSQWDAAVPLVQILCIASAIGAIWSLSGHVLMATGNVDRILRSEIIIQTSRVILIVLAAPFGLKAVAGVQIIVYIIGMLVYYRELFQLVTMSLRDIVVATYQSFGTTVCSLIVPLMVLFRLDITPEQIWLPFMLALPGAGVGWFCGMILTDHPAKQEITSVITKYSQRIFRVL